MESRGINGIFLKKWGVFALLVACFFVIPGDGQEIYKAVREGDLERVISLLHKDTSLVKARNKALWTPLHAAVSRSQKKIAEFLIQQGADVNARDNVEFTPLHRCMYNTQLDVIELLVENGANLNALNHEGVTPLSMAIDFEKMAIIELMVKKGANLRLRMRDNETVLHHAAETGNVQLIDFLIRHGAPVGSRKKHDITALHIASVYGHKNAVRLLINHGADVDASSTICGTPLHQAYAGGHKQVAKLLKDHGAIEAKHSFPVLKGDYLGEEKPGTNPRCFAPYLLKTVHRWVMTPTFSPDGKEIYWSASAPHSARSRLWCMTQKEGRWTSPRAVSFSQEYMDQNPSYSPAGDRMVFVSDRSANNANKDKKDRDFWIIKRKQKAWGKPESLGPFINTDGHEFHASIGRSGVLYFHGAYGENRGASDLYSSIPDGLIYREIKNLSGLMNTKYPEAEPAVAPDESYIIFVSLRPENRTFFDLYISFRNEDKSWTEAMNMGDGINRYNCRNPKVSPDGKYIFFHNDDDRTIYWVDAKITEALKPKELERAEVIEKKT